MHSWHGPQDHCQEVHMPTKHTLQMVAVLQTPMVDPPLVNLAATCKPESRQQTP